MSKPAALASPTPRIGEGRIGSFLCASIGLLSVAAVLCLRFPAYLTTPTNLGTDSIRNASNPAKNANRPNSTNFGFAANAYTRQPTTQTSRLR